jgi:hypothetical protein
MLNYKLPKSPQDTPVKVFYIGAADMKRDGLVNQAMARADWLKVHPGLTLITDDAIGHAWPMEQPTAYQGILYQILSTA